MSRWAWGGGGFGALMGCEQQKDSPACIGEQPEAASVEWCSRRSPSLRRASLWLISLLGGAGVRAGTHGDPEDPRLKDHQAWRH